ncbi:MAG: hypothetical protein K8I29_02615 [Alphaproteobacteria bacterium]|uniref:Response regulatory domain-containing protein n=1 Tax=Candidatus Nitrobium versatile TaxID=2884831 RepID=A0A953JC34_9BACT|nr:hypothetical protein [Candidatus Nitrobium versatile]
MGELKRSVFIVERDPELRSTLAAAFLHSGYSVQVADTVGKAAALIRDGCGCRQPFDLVLVCIVDKSDLDDVADLQRLSIPLPVLTIADDADKLLIVDLLHRKQGDFLEHFFKTNTKASEPS